MFTKKVLSEVRTPELRKALHLDAGNHHESRLSWVKDDEDRPPKPPTRSCITPASISNSIDVTPANGSLQQSDLLRRFYLAIAMDGLQYAYDNASSLFKPEDLPRLPELRSMGTVKTNLDKHVIIVGAGISGMVAAYELRKAGYSVQILEMSQRYGGRVKTLTEKDGFDQGLHTDAGAMRLPLPPTKSGEKRPIDQTIHYLTDYYAEREFDCEPVPFSNEDTNAFYHFYGESTQIKDWKDSQFNDYWPGWNKKVKKMKDITSPNVYLDKTTDIVIRLLKHRLKDIPKNDLKAQAKQWDLWTDNWCQFSFAGFLRSTYEGVVSQLKKDEKMTPEYYEILEGLKKFLPWPEMAITAFSVFNYFPFIDRSLVTMLQESMGKWWASKMHSLKGGLSTLSDAFAANEKWPIEPLITYNRTVMKVEYLQDLVGKEKSVKVHGVITSSGQPFCVEGRSVILTVPLHVLRGIQIVNADSKGKPFPKEFQQAIQNISYSPSTKIMLQYEKKFWNADEKAGITGGFSKTNMPIGQLHYPTEAKVSHLKGERAPKSTKDQPGILMVYNWQTDALLWGALSEDQAITLAVNQIDEIHPDIDTKALFQVGKRQAWANDPTTLGAFALLQPRDYINVLYLMQNSWKNVYFAGEAISFANGWIQGALESGLRAAYQLFKDDQQP